MKKNILNSESCLLNSLHNTIWRAESGLEDFETVEITSQLQNQHYEVEIDLDIIKYLQTEAQNRQITVGYLVNQILREKIPD